jgi:hypothetical protein
MYELFRLTVLLLLGLPSLAKGITLRGISVLSCLKDLEGSPA